MDYSNRKYYWEIENEFGVVFPMLKSQLNGKLRDGITEAQKRALWALGVNTTGIRYKGSAMYIIGFMKSSKKEKKNCLYQVLYRKGNTEWKYSKQVFRTAAETDYEIGKNIPPEYDVRVIEYTDVYYQTDSGKCFADKTAARKTGENFYLFIIR